MGESVVILYVLVGGIIGTLGRWYLGTWIQTSSGAGPFPLGTLLINLSGSLVLGFVARLGADGTLLSPETRAGLAVGLCGSFTTMSAFSFESVRLIGEGDYVRAAVYIGGTILGCLGAVVLGSAVAARVM